MDARAKRTDRWRLGEGIRNQVKTRAGGKEVLTVAGGEGGQKGEGGRCFSARRRMWKFEKIGVKSFKGGEVKTGIVREKYDSFKLRNGRGNVKVREGEE